MRFAKFIEAIKNCFPVIMSRKKVAKIQQREEAFRNLFIDTTHEIKQPVVSARGFVGRVIKGQYGELANKEALEKLNKVHIDLSMAELRITSSITEIGMLDFDEDGDFGLKVETNIWAGIIGPILYAHSEKIKAKDIVIKNRIEKDATIKTNRNPLSSVFSNLISNGVNYGPEGCEIVLDSYINMEEKRRYFSVSDSGDPLDEEFVKKRLFGMFQQADPSSKKGTGVGLCVNKKMLQLMGGDIIYNREKHEFLFWLPME